MKIIIRNQAGIPNRFLRFAKWKLRSITAKLNYVEYAEIYVSKEGQSPGVYQSVIKLGVPGNDLILKNKAEELKGLWKKSMTDVQRHLRKFKESKT